MKNLKRISFIFFLSLCLLGATANVAAAYVSMVGSAESWSWLVPTAGKIVRSGSAESWSWLVWAQSSGRKVPQGSAEAWTWANE